LVAFSEFNKRLESYVDTIYRRLEEWAKQLSHLLETVATNVSRFIRMLARLLWMGVLLCQPFITAMYLANGLWEMFLQRSGLLQILFGVVGVFGLAGVVLGLLSLLSAGAPFQQESHSEIGSRRLRRRFLKYNALLALSFFAAAGLLEHCPFSSPLYSSSYSAADVAVRYIKQVVSYVVSPSGNTTVVRAKHSSPTDRVNSEPSSLRPTETTAETSAASLPPMKPRSTANASDVANEGTVRVTGDTRRRDPTFGPSVQTPPLEIPEAASTETVETPTTAREVRRLVVTEFRIALSRASQRLLVIKVRVQNRDSRAEVPVIWIFFSRAADWDSSILDRTHAVRVESQRPLPQGQEEDTEKVVILPAECRDGTWYAWAVCGPFDGIQPESAQKDDFIRQGPFTLG